MTDRMNRMLAMAWLPMLLVVTALAFFWRIYRIDNDVLTCETQNFLWGIRLHQLGWLNIRDVLYNNAIKSLLGTIGGIRWAMSTYVSSGIYYLLGIPVSEFWILTVYAVLGTILIWLTYALARVWGNGTAGILAALAIAVNPRIIHASRWDDAEPTVSVAVCLGVMYLFVFRRTKSLWVALIYGLLLSLLFSMESIMLLPLILAYALVALEEGDSSLVGRLRSFGTYVISPPGLLVMAPLLMTAAAHFWTFRTIGGENSHLGLFGLMSLNYGEHPTLSTLWPRLVFVTDHYASYFFGHRFFNATIAAFVVALALNRFRFPDVCLKYATWAAVYCFVIFTWVTSTFVIGEHLYVPESLSAIFIGATWDALRRQIARLAAIWSTAAVSAVNLAAAAVVAVAFWSAAASATTTALNEPVLIHPFKSVGYYVRTYGGTDARVFNLWECQELCFNQLTEYYYGKQFIDIGDRVENPRKIFCQGSASNDEILAAYGLDEFTMFVRILAVYREFPDGTRDTRHGDLINKNIGSFERLKAAGAHKVAEVTHGGQVLAEIYSRKDLPYLSMDRDEYDKRWGQEFARVDRILEGRRVGIVSIFGAHFDTKRGF